MSMNQIYEDARDQAQVHLDAVCNELNLTGEATPPDQELIREGLQKVEDAYDELVSVLCDYVSNLGQNVTDEVHQEFMRTREMKMNKSLDKAKEMLFEMDRASEIAGVERDTLNLAEKIQDTVGSLLHATEVRMSATTHKQMTE